MRVIFITLLAFALAGCNSSLAKCDEAIKSQLKSPSSYKRISSDGSGPLIKIQYDAENSYGVALREKATCFVYRGEDHANAVLGY